MFDTCAPISNLGYRVMVELTDKEKGEAKKIHCKEWESLLNDVRRDWAANLILYYLYKKDAHLLARKNSRILCAVGDLLSK